MSEITDKGHDYPLGGFMDTENLPHLRLPHIKMDRGLWIMSEGEKKLAWAWTLNAFIVAFKEDENILQKIRNFSNYHIYAMIPNHPISEDGP